MKSLVAALSVLLFAGTISAQNPSPVPTGASHHDSMLMKKNAPDGDAGPMAMCQHGGKRLFPGHGMNFSQDSKAAECCAMQSQGIGKTHRMMCGPRSMRCCPPPLCCGILFLGILLWGIINILLTIIVSLDMTKSGRFNGLWIPLLLIAGIPVSIIYALFRIGDKIPCKST
jgi:hypothetical protein